MGFQLEQKSMTEGRKLGVEIREGNELPPPCSRV